MNWDWVISVLVLLILGLGFWAKMTQQTIKELLTELIELIKGEKEEEYYEY